MIPPENIVCVDCGGTCHLLSYLPEDEELEPGDVVAYRAVQEALTNATKHGDGARAHLLVHSTAEQVRIVVTNPTAADAFAGDGFGLSGMRERVAAVRGTMEIAIEAGVFRLAIVLPRDRSDEAGWQEAP